MRENEVNGLETNEKEDDDPNGMSDSLVWILPEADTKTGFNL